MTDSRKKTFEDIRFQKRLSVSLLTVGVVSVVVAVFVFAHSHRAYRSAIHTSGKIVELDRRRDKKIVTCFPVFSFVDRAGTSHVVHSKFGYIQNRWGLAPHYAVGDTVEVIFPAEDPQNARLNDIFSLWGWTVLLGGGGLVLMIAGVVLWRGAVSCSHLTLSSRPEAAQRP